MTTVNNPRFNLPPDYQGDIHVTVNRIERGKSLDNEQFIANPTISKEVDKTLGCGVLLIAFIVNPALGIVAWIISSIINRYNARKNR